MGIKFATWNIELRPQHANKEVIEKLKEFLAEAVWESDGEDLAFITNKDGNVVRLGIPFDGDNGLALLEAGTIIGNCEAEYRKAKLDYGFGFWRSINAEDGGVIESPYI